MTQGEDIMVVGELLKNIGFTEEEQKTYFHYKSMVHKEIEEYSCNFMKQKISFSDALSEIHEICKYKLHEYTLDLLFVAESMCFLYDKYEEKGIGKDIFFNTMSDLKYKLDECLSYKKIFGTFVVNWYKEFFTLDRFAFGRLQFDNWSHKENSIKINGYTINKGDFVLGCHIPSSGPLTPALCESSFKEAYSFVKDRLKDGILPIETTSWMLYPKYSEVLDKNSNVANFQRYFEIVSVIDTEKFDDAWRFFGREFDGDISKLPSKTTLQRNFIEYIKRGNGFGLGKGFILFDGENILTRKFNKE